MRFFLNGSSWLGIPVQHVAIKLPLGETGRLANGSLSEPTENHPFGQKQAFEFDPERDLREKPRMLVNSTVGVHKQKRESQ